MRLAAFGTALAIMVAGASSLGAEQRPPTREDAWGAFLERCEKKGSPRRVESKKQGEARLRKALARLSESDKERIRERLRRIELMTKAWVAAERQARSAAVARRVMAMFMPLCRQADLRPAVQMLLRLNGFPEPKRRGVLGRKTGTLI